MQSISNVWPRTVYLATAESLNFGHYQWSLFHSLWLSSAVSNLKMLQSLCTSFAGDPVSAIALGPMSLRAETVFDLPELKFGIISFVVYF